jgi:Tfp pilus assembly protein PilE
MRPTHHAPRRRAGFNLVELAVLVVSVGLLAAFGVPRFVHSVERSRAAEGVEYLASVRASQERYQARYGTYAARVADLDIESSPPRQFSVPADFAAGDGHGLRDSWRLTLTRTGPSAGHGAYTITFTETGFDATAGPLNVSTLPEINPIGH